MQLKCMVDHLANSLNKKKVIQAFKDEAIYLTFHRKYYYNFLPRDLFNVSNEKVQFDNVLEFFDWIFLLSHLIDSANVFYALTKARINHYLLDYMPEEKQLQFQKDNLEFFRKSNREITVSEINQLLCELRNEFLSNYSKGSCVL